MVVICLTQSVQVGKITKQQLALQNNNSQVTKQDLTYARVNVLLEILHLTRLLRKALCISLYFTFHGPFH